jgi:hypothetical protein
VSENIIAGNLSPYPLQLITTIVVSLTRKILSYHKNNLQDLFLFVKTRIGRPKPYYISDTLCPFLLSSLLSVSFFSVFYSSAFSLSTLHPHRPSSIYNLILYFFYLVFFLSKVQIDIWYVTGPNVEEDAKAGGK